MRPLRVNRQYNKWSQMKLFRMMIRGKMLFFAEKGSSDPTYYYIPRITSYYDAIISWADLNILCCLTRYSNRRRKASHRFAVCFVATRFSIVVMCPCHSHGEPSWKNKSLFCQFWRSPDVPQCCRSQPQECRSQHRERSCWATYTNSMQLKRFRWQKQNAQSTTGMQWQFLTISVTGSNRMNAKTEATDASQPECFY